MWVSLNAILVLVRAAAAAESLQSCPILCNPIDGSPPGSSHPGILQARTLEWVAISFSLSERKWYHFPSSQVRRQRYRKVQDQKSRLIRKDPEDLSGGLEESVLAC